MNKKLSNKELKMWKKKEVCFYDIMYDVTSKKAFEDDPHSKIMFISFLNSILCPCGSSYKIVWLDYMGNEFTTLGRRDDPKRMIFDIPCKFIYVLLIQILKM